MDIAVSPSVVLRSSHQLKLTHALAVALLDPEQQHPGSGPTVPLFQSLFYGLASVAAVTEAEMVQVSCLSAQVWDLDGLRRWRDLGSCV